MPVFDLSSNPTPTTPESASRSHNGANVDLVLVHGLFEDGTQTWTDPATGIHWVRDLFPASRFRTRTLAYSYGAESLLSPGDGADDRLRPFAINLVAELCADRQFIGASKRPIIFVCHGLGGLLVKKSLVYSSTRQSTRVRHLRSIFVSTYAIIFIGTPHEGITKESLVLQYPRSGRREMGPSQFILNLIKGSEMLQDISDQFSTFAARFVIYNLWEQKKTEFGKNDSYIVEEASAAPVWDDTEKCGISATHQEMTKFSSRQIQGYRVLLEALQRYIKNAPSLIEYRWEKEVQTSQEERQREAEDLMRPSLQHTVHDTPQGNLNQWFLVPRGSSTLFTGRQIHAQSVQENLGRLHDSEIKPKEHRICVIHGLGGAGKTQFCLRYVEDNKLRYWGVFWIDASSEENAEASYAAIGQQMDKGSTFTSGIYWLSQRTQPWILVIDNADDPELDVQKFFPAGGHGHILITTRNPRFSELATAGHLRFGGMDPEEGVNLLLKTASLVTERASSTTTDRRIANLIASELGYLALALAQAGATIRRRIYTLEKYLHYYLGHRKRMILSSNISNVDQANIITTWEIPFQRIARRPIPEYQDAAQMIQLFAFMHFDDIPEAVLRHSFSEGKGGLVLSGKTVSVNNHFDWNEESQVRLQAALNILCEYSIIDYDHAKRVVSLHPVVQRWIQERLPEDEQRKWLDSAILCLAHCISPNMEASGCKSRRKLLPHIESCLRALNILYGTTYPRTVGRTFELEKFASVLAENGLWSRARSYQSTVLEFRMKKLGRFNAQTIQAQKNLAQTNWNLFDIRPAIMTQLQILGAYWFTRPRVTDWLTWPPWRPTHVNYCVTLSDLSLSLWLAGRRERSKQLGERAVTGLERRLGSNDPLTLTAMFNLARTELHLGNQEESRRLLVQVLRKRKRFFGNNHMDTLMARNELGMCLCAQKRNLVVAERLVQNVLMARKHLLGDEHAYTLWSLNDLAKVKYTRRRAEEAIEILEQMLPIVRRTLGDRHVGMFMTNSNLAIAYVMAKRWQDAEVLLQELLQGVPEDHPDRVHILSGYIYIKTVTGRKSEAESDCLRLLEMITRKKLLSPNSPRTLAIAEQLAWIYQTEQRSEELRNLLARYPSIESPEKLQFNVWHV